MKYFVFDTESTGLFDYRLPADAPGQPRLCHLAGFGIDTQDPTIMQTFDYYIKPDGWVNRGEALEVNGLTMEKLGAEGVPVVLALDAYGSMIDQGFTLVAYNAQHDMKQMRAELRRAGMDDRFERSPNICLMRLCHKVGVVKPDGGRGWPKLAHSAAHFGVQMGRAHEGLSDAAAALRIFQHLLDKGLVPEGEVHYAKDRPIPVDPQIKMDF